jgi:hypothetical protein
MPSGQKHNPIVQNKDTAFSFKVLPLKSIEASVVTVVRE